MNDYKATVLQLLADIGSADPPAGPVISTSQFHAEVLRLLGEIASAGGGGGGGALVVKEVYNEATDSYALDKTVGELLDAAPNVIYVATSKGGMSTAYSLVMWGLNSGTYGFQFGDSDMFVAESTDDYPVRYSEDDPGA